MGLTYTLADRFREVETPAQRLGRVLYPSLFARRDAEAHRRACEAMHAAAIRVSTKQDPASADIRNGVPTSTVLGGLDGCYAECA